MGASDMQPVIDTTSMRVHLGAGNKYWPGWVNVDVEGDQDVTANVNKLPFEDGSVSEIQCMHLLEHIERMKVAQVLGEWWRVLKPRGKLVIEVPCLDEIAKMIVAGERNMRLTLFGLFGDPREESPYMAHRWCWSKEEISEQLAECGFGDIEFDKPVFHIPARDMRVIALKGGAV